MFNTPNVYKWYTYGFYNILWCSGYYSVSGGPIHGQFTGDYSLFKGHAISIFTSDTETGFSFLIFPDLIICSFLLSRPTNPKFSSGNVCNSPKRISQFFYFDCWYTPDIWVIRFLVIILPLTVLYMHNFHSKLSLVLDSSLI